MKESDFAKIIIAWLADQHWEIYQEVQPSNYGGIADIVAVQGPLVWVIECKMSLSLGVMEQASIWRVHFRSVAVPSARNRNARIAAYNVAKRHFKIGVLVAQGREVWQVAPPPYMREFRLHALKFKNNLEPEHKTYAEAGNAEGRRWTPYKRTIKDVRLFLEKNPGATMKEIQNEIGRGHYASPASCRANLRNALELWEDWCEVDKSERAFRYSVKD